MSRSPMLRFRGNEKKAKAVVLLLHGGTPHEFAPVRPFDPSVLRLIPFGRSVVRAGDGHILLASLRYAVRGWNGHHESPLPDAHWALERILERYGDLPIGLVGHSMGGRVALRVADHRGVRSVAALAPWLPEGEVIPQLDEQKVLLAHGTLDHTTDPQATFDLAEKLAADGVEVELVKFPGARHAMMFPATPWHDLVAGFMVRTLLLTGPPGGPEAHRPR